VSESRTQWNETSFRPRPIHQFGTKLSDSQNTHCGCACSSRAMSEVADAHGRLPPTGGRQTNRTPVSDKPHRRGDESDPFTASLGECVRVFAVPHDHRHSAVGVRTELNSSAAVRSILARRQDEEATGHPTRGTSRRTPVALIAERDLRDTPRFITVQSRILYPGL
jgi:hypothetical protein